MSQNTVGIVAAALQLKILGGKESLVGVRSVQNVGEVVDVCSFNGYLEDLD